MEAFRRRAGQQPSTAGFPPGVANLNPLAGIGPEVLASAGGGTPQPPSFMSQPGIQQLQKSQPGEAEIIVKALIRRLRALSPEGGTQ